jgi:hypothetical protein
MEEVPEGLFICPNCVRAGVTEAQLKQRAAILSNQPPPREVLENLFKPRVTRIRDEAARAMDGRIVGRNKGTKAGNITQQWGVVHYRGAEQRPKYFEVYYGDPEVAKIDRNPQDVEILTHAALKRRMIMPEGTLYHAPVTPRDPASITKPGRGRPRKNATFT